MNRRASIGFDRKLQLQWLDFAAAKAAEGVSPDDLRTQLLGYLDSLAHGNEASGSARSKTARVMLRIWGGVDRELRPLHDRALRLLPGLAGPERFALHWAMTIAAYPFFADHAAAFGRLFSLQEVATTAQIQRRLAEQWGERSTVLRTSRHVVRTMVDWGVLADVGKGTYRFVGPRPVSDAMVPVLAEAVLLDTEQDSLSVDQINKHPALFPFEFRITAHHLRRSERMQVFRQGVDADVVALCRSS